VIGDGDGGGGGKYGTPGAGVIIYLAPEIGPADTAGRFNGRTMLELTKTKTKHQLGDFFFHFSFAFLTSLLVPSLSLSLSLFRACSLARSLAPPARFARLSASRRGSRKVRTQCVRMHDAPMPSSISFLPRAAAKSHALNCTAPFGAQVAALSRIAVNKLPGEIASRAHRRWASLGLIVALGRAESKVPPRHAIAQSSSGGTKGGRVTAPRSCRRDRRRRPSLSGDRSDQPLVELSRLASRPRTRRLRSF